MSGKERDSSHVVAQCQLLSYGITHQASSRGADGKLVLLVYLGFDGSVVAIAVLVLGFVCLF